jgi:mRNA interferase HigB
MQIISYKTIKIAKGKYGNAASQLDVWYRAAKSASWQNLAEVRQTYPDAGSAGNFTVFNIKGKQYRLIVGIDYGQRKIYIKYFLTHAEYSKDTWKNDPYY